MNSHIAVNIKRSFFTPPIDMDFATTICRLVAIGGLNS